MCRKSGVVATKMPSFNKKKVLSTELQIGRYKISFKNNDIFNRDKAIENSSAVL